MTHQSHIPLANMPAGTGRQVVQLREVLALVERIAGRTPSRDSEEAALDEDARLSTAYADALPIVQRRFDALAGETAAWAAAGVEALLAAGRQGRQPVAAARRLANELHSALRELSSVLRP